MLNNFTRQVAGLAFLIRVSEAVSGVPCYGYGAVFGTPSNYIVDDISIVKGLKIGQDGAYVAHIKFLFELTNYLQFGYRKKGDENYLQVGNSHGNKSKTSDSMRRINFVNPTSRMLNPSYVFNES